ncbi:complement factor B-like [Eucyclogobius newberryi]|uniref:complement factor B-like n=1 Tax=Eucyclogobius newberryi TaxID=166745 RepID=UPI003B59609F
MGPFHWTWFVAVLCILIKGNAVRCNCSLKGMAIQDGNFSLSNGLNEGSVLQYQCHEGYYPHPELAYRCQQDHHWTPEPESRATCKRVECPDPTVFQNGYILPINENRRYYYRSTITYHCYSGYTLHGPSQRTCLENGKWNGSNPVCQQENGDCRDPGVPPGGKKTGNRFDFGDKVTYKCSRNMILIGSEERECQLDGQWSGKETHCYYKYTFDSPWEVTEAFGGEIKNTLSSNLVDGTQTGRLFTLKRNGTLNIFIALDISESIDDEELKLAKQAVITLIDKIEGFSVHPNYEVIFFSSKIQTVINILHFYNEKTQQNTTKTLKDKIKTFEVKDAADKFGTNLDAVFKQILEKIAFIKEQETTNTFSEHHHVIILFTDGAFNIGPSPAGTLERIKSLVYMGQSEKRKNHLDLYVFGVGAQIHDENLKVLTADSKNNYFKLKSLKDLQQTFDEIIDESEVRGLCGLHRYYAKGKIREKYPWVINIIVLNDKRPNCFGSLVSPHFILTAAHCFKDMGSIENVVVTDGAEMQFGVEAVHIHPNYKLDAKLKQGVTEFYDYDVALIQLVNATNITSSLRPICIPCTAETNAALKGTLSCKEQETFLLNNHERVTFLTKKTLKEKVAHVKLGESRHGCIMKAKNASITVTENFLCTGGISPFVDHISCKGESGGAVFKNYENRIIQVALVSWGNKKMPVCDSDQLVYSTDNSRDFHMNLFKVVPFLKSILGNQTQKSYAPLLFVD